jgi:uncharacterized membrane protein
MESEILIVSTDESPSSMLPPATGSTNINVGLPERISSVVLGTASTLYGLRHLGSLGGLALTAAGSFLLYRGLTGYCAITNAFDKRSVSRKSSAMETNQSFTINKPKSEVYAFWRRLENLPMFMKHLEEVKVEDNIRSTWRAQVPGGLGTVSWESVITEDRPDEIISWASLPGSTIDNAGEVKFKDAPAGGTEIQVCMTYRLPAGDIGSLAGKLFNPAVENMIDEDIRRFKSIMETGEVTNSGPQSSTPSKEEGKPKKQKQSRKRPDAGIGNRPDRDVEVNQSDLLERNQLDY